MRTHPAGSEKRATGYLPAALVAYREPLVWCALAACMAAVVLIRLRFLGMPLERDEGEYAYMAQLLIDGVMPYVTAYSMKLPGIYAVYAMIMALFGQTTEGIRLGLAAANCATIVLVFLIGRRLLGIFAGFVAACVFAVLTLDCLVHGLVANAEHFALLAACGGLYSILCGLDKNRNRLICAGGLLLGCAFLIKQHSLVFALFAFSYLWWYGRHHRRDGKAPAGYPAFFCAVGVVSPVLLVGLVYAMKGHLGALWFWTVGYAAAYASRDLSCLYYLLPSLARVSVASWPLWCVAACGFAALWQTDISPERRFVLAGLFIASFAGIFPGLYFRQHYFLLVMPALALLAAFGVAVLRVFIIRQGGALVRATIISLLVIAVCAGYLPVCERRLFAMTPVELSRAIFSVNPFPESVVIAERLRQESSPTDTIAVLGSEPQIYFYAKRRAATGFLYMYPLMDDNAESLAMQRQMAREIESARPRFLVFVNVDLSWAPWVVRDQLKWIFRWFDGYYKKYYSLAGVVNIIPRQETVFVWGDAARTYRPRSPYLVHIFKLREEV